MGAGRLPSTKLLITYQLAVIFTLCANWHTGCHISLPRVLSAINQSTGDLRVAIAAGARFGHYCIPAPLGARGGQSLARSRFV